MEKMPVVFLGHEDPMIALKINKMTETSNKIGRDIIKRYGELNGKLCFWIINN